jgi:hypothetical protein
VRSYLPEPVNTFSSWLFYYSYVPGLLNFNAAYDIYDIDVYEYSNDLSFTLKPVPDPSNGSNYYDFYVY